MNKYYLLIGNFPGLFEDGLLFLRVHSVLGLGEHYWIGSLDGIVCHLHSSLCGQTVHKVGTWASDLHQGFIHLQYRVENRSDMQHLDSKT
jgi:hypothetical protein